MVFEKVRGILAERMGVAEDDITLDSSLDDLGMDDLDLVEAVMDIEEEYDIEIPDDESLNFSTVGDMVDYIKANT